jgi:hypothetical protein
MINRHMLPGAKLGDQGNSSISENDLQFEDDLI